MSTMYTLYYKYFTNLNKILSLTSQSPITVSELGDATEIKYSAIRKYIADLEGCNLLSRSKVKVQRHKSIHVLAFSSKISELDWDYFAEHFNYKGAVFKQQNKHQVQGVIKGARVFTTESLAAKLLEQSKNDREYNRKRRYNVAIGSSFNLV